MPATRLISLDDVPTLVELLRANREFMSPWEPDRDEEFFTAPGQQDSVRAALERYEQGAALPHVILDATDRVVGRITLNEIVRGPFQSASMGYWLNRSDNGRGLTTTAVMHVKDVAFDELGLHRIQASTLLDNVRSQRVLERTGFVRFGLAPAYLHIAGQWRDHALYQVLTPRPARPS